MRKLATFTGAFALGVFLAQYLLPDEFLLPGCGLFLLLTGGAFALPKGKRLGVMLLCGGFSLALGYDFLYVQAVQQPMLVLADSQQTVTMTLCDYPEETDWGSKATVRLDGFFLGKAVYYGDKDLLDLHPGQTVTDQVAFQNAARIRDDDVTSFTSKGVFLMAYSCGEAAYGTGTMDSPRWWPLRVGKSMRDVIRSLFDGDTAGFLMAILTGETSGLSEEGKITLSEAGLYHILAVSGMHCGYLLAMVELLTGRHRRRLLSASAIALLVFYAFLTGGSPSVLRACVMLTFLLLAPLFGRDNDAPTALTSALFLILLANPFAAASISLQLSFGAMAGILYLTPRLYRLLTEGRKQGKVLRFLASSFSATMGALVFTVPLSGYYFGILVLISPLSNLLCLWAAGLTFFLGMFTLGVGAVFVPLARLLSPITSLLIHYILGTANGLSYLPYHAVYFANPYLKYWLLYVYVLFGIACFFGQKARRKYAAAAVLAVLTLVLTVKLGQARYQNGLDIIVLDVGQGQCVVLKSGDGFALVDCGSGNSWYDAGELAVEQLRSMGCESLDYLFLTHYDTDHVSGVEGLLARMNVKTLVIPPEEDDSGLQADILAAAAEHGVEMLTIYGQAHILLGETTLNVYPPMGKKEDNERGLSVLATSGTDSILIPGDMSQETEAALLESYRLLPVDALVVGHHGAKTSTSTALLDALQPKIACISVGSNRYGHPADETLQRLAAQGCAVYRTDLQGSIHLSMNER